MDTTEVTWHAYSALQTQVQVLATDKLVTLSKLTSLGLSFLICIMGMTLYLPHRVPVRIKSDNTYKVFNTVLGTCKLSVKAIITQS